MQIRGLCGDGRGHRLRVEGYRPTNGSGHSGTGRLETRGVPPEGLTLGRRVAVADAAVNIGDAAEQAAGAKSVEEKVALVQAEEKGVARVIKAVGSLPGLSIDTGLATLAHSGDVLDRRQVQLATCVPGIQAERLVAAGLQGGQEGRQAGGASYRSGGQENQGPASPEALLAA